MTSLLALLSAIQKAEIACLAVAALLVLYVMNSLNLFKRE
jgi:hypothetical protein